MSVTKARAIINLFDTTAKDDGTYSVNTIFEYSDIDQLNYDVYETTKYATCEQDRFLLDGTYMLMDDPDIHEFSYWSEHVSDENGEFVTVPVITRVFENYHSSSGITLTFDPNYPLPKEIEIRLFDGQNTLNSGIFEPDDYTYFCDVPAENYKGIELRITETEPYSYARLLAINYGQSLVYEQGSERDVIKASLLEEIDIITSEVAINTSELKTIDADEIFDITNPDGLYKFLQERQLIQLFEIIDGQTYEMANHYLKEWSTENGVVSTFKCQDVLGLMDGTTFRGNLYEEVPAGEIIDEIMSDYDFSDYYVSQEIYDTLLSGVIAPCTHRQALQQVVFACGGVIDTSRSSGIRVYKTSHSVQTTITKDRIFFNPKYKITQEDQVSGVDVTAHHYIRESARSQAYKATLDPGRYEVRFSEPFESLTASNCTIESSGYYYAIISVSNTAEVLIQGYKYTDSISLFSIRNNDLPSGTKANIKTVKNATLVSRTNAAELAEHLYDFYQYRLSHELKIICGNEKAGNFAAAQSESAMAAMVVRQMNIDLTGGYLASIKGIGYSLKNVEDYYTGELRAGEEMGVI